MDSPKSLQDVKRENVQAEELQLENAHVSIPQDPLVNGEDPRIKAIKWKVDLRLSAILAVMYVVNQIDRTNLPNA
jgi:hypothetical protein